MIKEDETNHGKRKIGIIGNIYTGKDETIRIYTRKSIFKRKIQMLYPMELHCELNNDNC